MYIAYVKIDNAGYHGVIWIHISEAKLENKEHLKYTANQNKLLIVSNFIAKRLLKQCAPSIPKIKFHKFVFFTNFFDMIQRTLNGKIVIG